MQTIPILHREPGLLRIAPLNADATADFAGFTYPRMVGNLRSVAPPWTAIGAWVDQQPVGLALGRTAAGGEAELTSLFVKADARCHGVGRQLVTGLTQALLALGAHVIVARIGGSNPSRLALDRALTSLGWSALSCVEMKVTGFAAEMVDRSGQWKGVRDLLGTEALTFDHWHSLDHRDETALDSVLTDTGFNGGSRRFLAFEGLEPKVGVVIRRAGKAVGWVIGRRSLSPLPARSTVPAITYTSAFVERSLARRGVLIGGVWHAFTRQVEAFGPQSLATYQTATPRMIALSRRRFVPISLETHEVFASSFRLR
jgi:GNAT superfamily N-acetyltransferase